MTNQDFIRSYKNERAYVASEIARKQSQVQMLEHKYKVLTAKIVELEGANKNE